MERRLRARRGFAAAGWRSAPPAAAVLKSRFLPGGVL